MAVDLCFASQQNSMARSAGGSPGRSGLVDRFVQSLGLTPLSGDALLAKTGPAASLSVASRCVPCGGLQIGDVVCAARSARRPGPRAVGIPRHEGAWLSCCRGAVPLFIDSKPYSPSSAACIRDGIAGTAPTPPRVPSRRGLRLCGHGVRPSLTSRSSRLAGAKCAASHSVTNRERQPCD